MVGTGKYVIMAAQQLQEGDDHQSLIRNTTEEMILMKRNVKAASMEKVLMEEEDK